MLLVRVATLALSTIAIMNCKAAINRFGCTSDTFPVVGDRRPATTRIPQAVQPIRRQFIRG